MPAAKYSPVSPGREVEVLDEQGNRGLAFLPDRLPPQIDLGSKGLRTLLSAADRDLARLDGIARQIEHPEDLFGPYLMREAVLSSKIEGTRTTLAQLALFEAAGSTSDGDAQQVQNYVRAFEYGRSRLGELSVGTRLLNEVHGVLMEGTDPKRTTPGVVRDCTVLIGSNRLDTARFVPPPALFVNDLLENLEYYLRDDDEPPLLKIAIAHYQFESIHPYRDGNGRVGRLLISLFLQEQSILTVPMLYISSFFERHQQQYYDLLLRVSTENAWNEWISFFLEAVSTQARDAVERTRRLTALRAAYHDRVRQKRVSHALHDLIDELFRIPAISIPIAQKLLGMTYAAAKPHVMRLVEAGILNPEPIIMNNTKIYIAPEVIAIVEESLD